MSAYRPEWWPGANRNGLARGVLDLCDYLHNVARGSETEPDPEQVALYLRALNWLRDNWRHPSSMWERGLLTLVIRTLDEHAPKSEGPPDIVCRRGGGE